MKTTAGQLTRIKRLLIIMFYKDLRFKDFASWVDKNINMRIYILIKLALGLLLLFWAFGPYILN